MGPAASLSSFAVRRLQRAGARGMDQESMNAPASRRIAPGETAAGILEAPDLEGRCGLFLEAVRAYADVEQAVLALIDEEVGRVVEWC